MEFAGLCDTLRVNISTELKPRFIANKKKLGVYFCSVHNMKVPVHQMQSCFIICVIEFLIGVVYMDSDTAVFHICPVPRLYVGW